MDRVIAVLFGAVALSLVQGCATKTYGRQGGLTEFERTSMNCREIDFDIARTDGFIQRVNTESKFDGRDVLAFLGDFGIGNSMEKSAALESATTRLSQLNGLRAAKCSGVSPTVTAPQPKAIGTPNVNASQQPSPGMNDGRGATIAPGTCGWVDALNYVCR